MRLGQETILGLGVHSKDETLSDLLSEAFARTDVPTTRKLNWFRRVEFGVRSVMSVVSGYYFQPLCSFANLVPRSGS